MYTLGLDIGSTSSKGVILKDGTEIVAKVVVPLGTGTSGPAKVEQALFEQLEIQRETIANTIVTGYGRMTYKGAQKQISELSCHTRGLLFIESGIRTIIDIGGQDAKAMSIDANGHLSDFVMNDKCAAGTGRFLDVIARVLDVSVDELGALSEKSSKEVSISSTCTVFAESEVISHLSSAVPIEDIIAGVHKSIAKRVSSLAKRVGVKSKVAMVGGVAQNKGVVKAMREILEVEIIVPEMAQLTGALGAAVYAFDEIKDR